MDDELPSDAPVEVDLEAVAFSLSSRQARPLPCFRHLDSAGTVDTTIGGRALSTSHDDLSLPNLALHLELIFRVLEDAFVPRGDYNIDLLLELRGIFRLIHSKMRHYVDTTPHFWTYILLSPRVLLSFISTVFVRVGDLPFFLTLRCTDLSEFGDVTEMVQHRRADAFIRTATRTVWPSMSRCSALLLEAATPSILGSQLERFKTVAPVMLGSFSVAFGVDNFSDFDHPDIVGFKFVSNPLFGPAFAPFTIFSIMSTVDPRPLVTYYSTPQPALLVRQPSGHFIFWYQVFTMLASSSSLTKLVFIGVEFACTLDFAVSIPLTGVQILHLEFEGSRSMSDLVSRLVLPELHTVKITFADRTDLVCASLCPHILANVSRVILSGECEEDDGLDDFFRMLPRVEHLDLRGAAGVFVHSFHVASRTELERMSVVERVAVPWCFSNVRAANSDGPKYSRLL
ncbi:hypothetical protein C8R44DRAFT_855464 [Mycena epipterygia]|nr:hypothetical protein C8R44DRAFT_855464 [Mycena epipterygia]